MHCTPPSHPDYNYLSLSTKKLMKVVTDVNFKITQMINRQKAKDIFNALQFPKDWEDEEVITTFAKLIPVSLKSFT